MKLFDWCLFLGLVFVVDRPFPYENYFRREQSDHFSDQNNRKQHCPTKKIDSSWIFVLYLNSIRIFSLLFSFPVHSNPSFVLYLCFILIRSLT